MTTDSRVRGFSLIEVMIVVAIVGILALVAYPAYQQQVLKTKRTVAKGELQSLLARQEQYFINNRQYATDLTRLGYGGATSYQINEDGDEVASGGVYTVALVSPTATSFSLTAAPQGNQSKDVRCSTLGITSAGEKSITGAGGVSECW